MIKLNDYDTIFLDCDGVILDSNKIKTEAFASSLDSYPEPLVKEFLKYHKKYNGVSRYEKFKYFFTSINPTDEKDRAISSSLEKYSSITRESLLSCDLISGISDILKMISGTSKKVFVITGGDEEEVKFVFKRRSLDKYFTDILGSPKTKNENMEKVLDEHEKIGRCIFFGDSRIDYEVAVSFECEFVFVSEKSEWLGGESFIRESKCKSIPNFLELI
ncbi:HAD hydrolase-like protein [Gammaproteobacteria bacterium]|nr:HAD hydrolase-like protein [Gammaproteobacteria bacterium]